MLKVSIIFPNYNGKTDTLACLQSLTLLSCHGSQIEVIMVDNGSTDNSVKTVKRDFPRVKIITLGKNLGFAKAVNKGIKQASGNYLLITNNDVIFGQNFLNILIDLLEKEPRIGIAGGKIYYLEPKDKILFQGLRFNPWTGSINKLSNPEQPKESEWIQGCAMLVRKEVFEKVGLFDEGFFFSYEDLDFCHRAKMAGFRIFYFPRAVAWHQEGATIGRMGLPRKAYEIYKAKFRYLFKNCSFLQILSSTIVQFFFVAPYRKLIVRDPYFFIRPMILGYFYNLGRLPKIIRERQ